MLHGKIPVLDYYHPMKKLVGMEV